VTDARSETATFVSFDGGVAERTEFRRPDRYRMVEAGDVPGPRIARGGGYSYAAASFGAGSLVLDMARFNRVLGFAPERRLVEVEAGVTLGDMLDLTAPRGLWLPVQPGYPAITVGGCIAANVHGKSPAREGTFRRSVESLTLYHPRHGTLPVDRATPPGLFDLTCGGYGLTGVILSARLRLEVLPGPIAEVDRQPIGSLAEGLARVRDLTDASAFAYTWHDGTPARHRFGRGFVFVGTIPTAPVSSGRLTRPYRRLTAASRARWPVSVWGRLTAPLLTAGFRALEGRKPPRRAAPLFDAMFPFAARGDYFRLFGRRGLAEVQLLVPAAAADGVLAELERQILRAGAPALMVSLKLFRGDPGLLRFEGDGVCLTLDLVRSPRGLAFLPVLDELAIAAGALPHIVKDSRLPGPVVRKCYPEFERFRERLHVHDPARLFRSELSRRLEL
jgi:decaprenylphospho-beta-D-ribofuranose 2-oxidase